MQQPTPQQKVHRFRCPGCGADLQFAPEGGNLTCPYCGRQERIEPSGTAVEERSYEQYLQLHADQMATLAEAAHEGIGGVYIPFWTYDAYTASRYTGERGEHYYTTEHYTERDAQGREVQRTRQVQHTRWHPASGQVERWFDDILVPATRSLPPQRLTALEPWDLQELTGYEPAYLSGYRAQRYQVDLAEGFE